MRQVFALCFRYIRSLFGQLQLSIRLEDGSSPWHLALCLMCGVAMSMLSGCLEPISPQVDPPFIGLQLSEAAPTTERILSVMEEAGSVPDLMAMVIDWPEQQETARGRQPRATEDSESVGSISSAGSTTFVASPVSSASPTVGASPTASASGTSDVAPVTSSATAPTASARATGTTTVRENPVAQVDQAASAATAAPAAPVTQSPADLFESWMFPEEGCAGLWNLGLVPACILAPEITEAGEARAIPASAVEAGEYDVFFDQVFRQAAAWQEPVIFWWMPPLCANQAFFSDTPTTTAAKVAANDDWAPAFAYLVRRSRAVGADNILWGWCHPQPIVTSSPGAAKSFGNANFPGTGTADLLGAIVVITDGDAQTVPEQVWSVLREVQSLAPALPLVLTSFCNPAGNTNARAKLALNVREGMEREGYLAAYWLQQNNQTNKWGLRAGEGRQSWSRSGFSEHRPSAVQKWFLQYLEKRRSERR